MTPSTDEDHFKEFDDFARFASKEISEAMRRWAQPADTEREKINAHCSWDDDEDGNYYTACRHTFIFIDGNFEENGFIFCPFCGGRVTNHIHETGTDE
ncbi:MAG: hypothetical protein KAX46_01325 [Chromatiaceae bacterium]|nr:hypothetical protein [Chromatiaceae bacterium]